MNGWRVRGWAARPSQEKATEVTQRGLPICRTEHPCGWSVGVTLWTAIRCCSGWRIAKNPFERVSEEFVLASLLALPIVVTLVGLGSYVLAKRALMPLEDMACRAEAITSDRLHERLPAGEVGDELDHVANVFNGLLARLEQSFEQLRRFTSDASHELRTPLASIRSVGEVALQKDGTREAYRDTIGSMLEEVNRLTSLVDSLLTIARADSGHIHLHRTRTELMPQPS